MTLKDYRAKRDFEQTPEPAPSSGPAEEGGPLRFVVQKHQASHLHYDFRLELDGVLKSWAVPKGPSLNPNDRRLAMMVEDHPFDYRTFEGVIPEGNYGAGTVMVWDEGTYHVPGVEGREATEKALRQALHKGNLMFVLEGQKLRGEFALVRSRARQPDDGEHEENSWFLIKKQDQFAGSADVREEDRSAATGRTLDEIRVAERQEAAPAVTLKYSLDVSKLDLRGAPRASMPRVVKPMLATLTAQAFDRPGWLFELKWDGYRSLGEVQNSAVRLYSRKDNDFGQEYTLIAEDLATLDFDVLFDGEIVVIGDNGKPAFELLQNWKSDARGRLMYYVFDILHLAGRDLAPLPLARRRGLLKKVLPELEHVKLGDAIEEQGQALFRMALERGLEGIVAKDGDSPYRPGERGEAWLKIKTHHRQEAVIGGFTDPRGSRKDLGALVLGVYEGDELVYIGHTGGGFEDDSLSALYDRLRPLARKRSPFRHPPKTNAPVTWVEPIMVCEVRFAEWTKEGYMRQPIFLGLREDKDPRDVCRELPMPIAKNENKPIKFRKSSEVESEREHNEQVEIDGHTLKLTHLNKIYFPEPRLTKGEVIQYYRTIAPLILPYLKDRPQSLHRFPDGITGDDFFQKDVDDPPAWVETERVHSESEERDLNYLLCQNEATLAYMVNLGCIEINPWNSRRPHLDRPDFAVVDLDPEGLGFDAVIKVALTVHEVLLQADTPHYVKTSGATGLHIFVPLDAKYTYEQARTFANIVGYIVNARLPDITSLERSPSKRQGKIYMDYLQNRQGQTMASVYSLRPREGAPVSTPLRWDEVKPGLSPLDFTIMNIADRITAVGDLWQAAQAPAIDMERTLKALEKILKEK